MHLMGDHNYESYIVHLTLDLSQQYTDINNALAQISFRLQPSLLKPQVMNHHSLNLRVPFQWHFTSLARKGSISTFMIV